MPRARRLIVSLFCLLSLFSPAASIEGAEPQSKSKNNAAVHWLHDYAQAHTQADRQNRMLLVYFYDAGKDSQCERFEKETLDDPQVQAMLRNYVCVRVPLDAKMTIGKQQLVLLEQEAFQQMQGKPGIAIVDLRSRGRRRGYVVSEFPLTDSLWYTPEQMQVILSLPRGTLTQRTIIFAVRIHPEHPASTAGDPNPELLEEAESHARYQATIRMQGHQGWGSRFARILSRLPIARAPREVCAESWAGQNLVDAAIECVRCWRTSSGHWSAVSAHSQLFGYDMKLGANGVWYATGIVDAG